jgi:hypothetical protein
MKFSPWTAAAAVTLLLSVAEMAVATEDDRVCTGSKPFREVAQDEIYTMAELCRMREDSLRGDRGWTLPAVPFYTDGPAKKRTLLVTESLPNDDWALMLFGRRSCVASHIQTARHHSHRKKQAGEGDTWTLGLIAGYTRQSSWYRPSVSLNAKLT